MSSGNNVEKEIIDLSTINIAYIDAIQGVYNRLDGFLGYTGAAPFVDVAEYENIIEEARDKLKDIIKT